MIANLKARVAALEKTSGLHTTVLKMPDGSTRSISGTENYFVRLLGLTFEKDATPEQQVQLDLIRQSVSEEPDDGIVELIRALLNSPLNPPEIASE